MTNRDAERYPIGRFERPTVPLSAAARRALIQTIDELPSSVRSLAGTLTEAQLERRYRTGGWTIRQVVHHVPDSHMQGVVRMKLAVTEDHPTIKPYHEDRWAELADVRLTPVAVSLDLLEALHRRWVALLDGFTDEDFRRGFIHPAIGPMTVDDALAMYAWHGRHHTAHITNALSNAG
jgi:uncharacterized damage-inducible protein DinB